MSFQLNFYRYDHELMLMSVGSGDPGVIAAVDQEFDRFAARRERTDPEHEAGRQLAHHIIARGFPEHPGGETLRHRLAAQCLTTVFRIPGSCPSQVWRWRVFHDTIHTAPGFSNSIPEIVSVFEEGRPFYGSSCPDEAHYGHLTHEEVERLLDACRSHRAAFEAHPEARRHIGGLVELLEWATKDASHLWFGFW